MLITITHAILNVKNLIPGIGIASSVILNASHALALTISSVSHVTTQIIGSMTEERSALKLVETGSCLGNISVMMGTLSGMMDVVMIAIMNRVSSVFQGHLTPLLYVKSTVETAGV